MELPENLVEIKINRSTGPRTEEGKKRSSRNSFKHGLFAEFALLPGENQDEFDALYHGLMDDHEPATTTEQSLVHRIAVIQWKLIRIDRLEGLAVQHAIETGAVDGKFLGNYGLYSHRLNQQFQSLLKTLHAEQAPRLETYFRDYRQAVLLRDLSLRTNVPWNPADDGFVFSTDLLDRQLAFNNLWVRFSKSLRIFPTTRYQDERFAKMAV